MTRDSHEAGIAVRLAGPPCPVIPRQPDPARVAVPVRLLVSSLTQVPVVIGWFRPIVLLPLACISGMSTCQLDAILAHELAHIRRYDYLVNLLQTVVETLLFFHPAVWWISRRIRTEREHCYDDMAVAVCGSRVEYAEALASLEQQRAAIGSAMAARDKRDNTALARVRRILGVAADDGVRRTRVVGGVLSVLVLVVLCAGYVAVAGQPERESDETTAAESPTVKTDAETASIEDEAERTDSIAGHVIAGLVTDESGKPVAGARVEWGYYDDPPDKRQQTATNKRGEYRLAVDEFGVGYRLGVSAKGKAPTWRVYYPPWFHVRPPVRDEDAIPPERADFRLEPAHWISGLVVDSQDRPIEGVKINVRTAAEGWSSSFSSPSSPSPIPGDTPFAATTDRQGRFLFVGLPAKQVQLSLTAAYRHVNDRNYPVDQECRITMSGSGQRGIIRARVVQRDTKQPVPIFRVAHRYDPAQRPFTSPDGRFTWDDELTEGKRYSMYVYARGFAPAAVGIPAVPLDSDNETTIDLSPSESLVGGLFDADTGRPMAGVSIMYGVVGDGSYFEWPGLENYIDGHHGLSFVQRAVVGSDGKFWFAEGEGNEQGTLFVLVPGYERLILKPEERQIDPDSGELRIALHREASISGVFVKKGRPQANVEVSVWKKQADGELEEFFERIETDSDGTYRFGCLAPGTYNVAYAQRPSRSTWTPKTFWSVTLLRGQQKRIEPVAVEAGTDGPAKDDSKTSAETSPSDAEKLVDQMRGMSMQARRPRSDGRPDPIDARRLEILARLRTLGTKAVPALATMLQDSDVQMRRNAALVLIELQAKWTGQRIVDTRAAVPALIKALSDQDADVRAWSAHALAEIGLDAAEAVPALIKLLKDPAEGPRNTATMALGGIGPAASKAIPALTEAMEDESADVRSFAAAAIKRIRGEKPDSDRRPERLHWSVKGTDDVLFALDDIVRFDWERQVVELKREKAMDLMGLQGPHVARGREFQARDAAGVLYEGRVVSPSSSIAYDGPTIIHPNFELSPPLFEIAAGYPGALRENDQRRFHPRLRTALEKAGKLAVIPADEKPSAIVKKGTEWAGDRNRLMVRAEIFPETFRIGAEARAHVFFAPQRKEPLPQDARIEVHSTVTTDGGAFFCTTDHSMRDSETSATVFRRGVTVLRWQPWGPVYGAEQSEAKPGPGEIKFRAILRDAGGKAIGEYTPAPLDVTILPPSDKLTVDRKIKALIGGAAVATRYEDIEIFEPTPGVAGEYRIRADVRRFPLPSGPTVTAPFGELFYVPKKNVCYIQWDPGGASTLHYYGPIEGAPDDLLAGLTSDDESEDRTDSTSTGSTPVPAKTSVDPPDEDSASRRTRGTVSGVVTDAATGKPVSGAYIAIDRSGDAGGSNLGRFREQGTYVTGETDTEGRFVLQNVAFSDQHPFYVTCADYVRHEQFVAVSNAEPVVHVDVRLKAGAAIEVTAVDGDKRPLTGETWIRLESKAGPIFVPPREDWPRTTMRTERVKDGRARFGELPTGEYSIDVMRIGSSDDELRSMMRDKTPEQMKAALSTTARELTYHSSTKSVTVGAGESIVREVPPLGHASEITINVAKDPYTVQEQAFVAFVVSRDPGRLLWIGRQFFHPEDHRLGRILRDDMVRVILVPGQSCRLRNLPPGDYAAFAYSMGLYPNFKSRAIFARAVKLEIRNGVTKTVNIPWTDPEGPSFVGPRALMALDTLVQVESRSYSVAELCSMLAEATDSRAKFQAAPSSKDRSVTLQAAELSIWQLLERLYLHQGWEVTADKDTFTIAAPNRKRDSA